MTASTELELIWDDEWDTPPTPPRKRVRVFDSVRLHTSTDMHGKPVRLEVDTVPAADGDSAAVAATLVVGRESATWDTTTDEGRAAVSDLIASLTAALMAGKPCEGCGAAVAEACGPDCLSHVDEES